MSRTARAGWGGVALGLLAVLTCELPLIIAFLGFGGVLVFDFPVWLEPAGIIVASASAAALLFWRVFNRRKGTAP